MDGWATDGVASVGRYGGLCACVCICVRALPCPSCGGWWPCRRPPPDGWGRTSPACGRGHLVAREGQRESDVVTRASVPTTVRLRALRGRLRVNCVGSGRRSMHMTCGAPHAARPLRCVGASARCLGGSACLRVSHPPALNCGHAVSLGHHAVLGIGWGLYWMDGWATDGVASVGRRVGLAYACVRTLPCASVWGVVALPPPAAGCMGEDIPCYAGGATWWPERDGVRESGFESEGSYHSSVTGALLDVCG